MDGVAGIPGARPLRLPPACAPRRRPIRGRLPQAVMDARPKVREAGATRPPSGGCPMTLTWRMTLGVGLLALLLGGLGGFLLSQAGTNRQILALQLHRDSLSA